MIKKILFITAIIAVFISCSTPPKEPQKSQSNTVEIRINNDKAQMIESAFVKVLHDAGMQIGGTNPGYILEVSVELEPVEAPAPTMRFIRIIITANLIKDGATVLPYSFNLREGHTTIEAAEDRVFRQAATKIGEEYSEMVRNLKI
jgi:hypothetical protein